MKIEWKKLKESLNKWMLKLLYVFFQVCIKEIVKEVIIETIKYYLSR